MTESKDKAKSKLIEIAQTLTDLDLVDIVEVEHMDGSFFYFTNATARYFNEWLLVWTKNHGNHLFYAQDFEHIQASAQKAILDA